MSAPAVSPSPAHPTATGPGPLARGVLAVIGLYRDAISPTRLPTCRYLPTCSEYAAEAVRVHGAGRGGWLALRRLLRCHPLHAGGHDPVPPARADHLDPPSLG